MFRLICTNGMITRQFSESLKLKETSHKAIESFHFNVEHLEKNNFQPVKFIQKLKSAAQVPASINEIEKAMALLNLHFNITKDELCRFIPYQQIWKDYRDLGVEATKLSSVKKRNARSGMTAWELINCITDFASHDYGYTLKPGGAQKLQIAAGDMLCKEYDISNLVDVNPYLEIK